MPVSDPFIGLVTTAKVRGSPSGSVAVRLRAREVSSGVVKVLGVAVGASLTALTVIVMVETELSVVPS